MAETKTDKLTPDTKGDIFAAILAVQQEAPSLQKNAINPHFKSKYISLDALMEAILPILNKHGLIWITLPCVMSETNEPGLGYALVHAATGTKLEGTMPLQARSTSPQDQGSAITYARRYSLMAVLGLVADEDDDANQATDAVKAPASEVNKQNILALLAKLGKAPDEFEKNIGRTLDSLTNTEAGAYIQQLKTRVQRQNAEDSDAPAQ